MMLLALAGCLFVSDKELFASADRDGDGVIDHALGGDDCEDDDASVTTLTVHRDVDGDTLGDPATATPGCPGAGWVENADDCDDTDAAVGAGAAVWRDADGDGYGDPATTDLVCAPGGGWVDNADDCDDADAARRDETRSYWADADGDGYGDAATPVDACAAPDGYVDNDEDCDDADRARHERAVSYADADGDGYGDPATWEIHCHYLDGAWTSDDTDCDDADPEVNPGAHEWGPGDVDHDCDGQLGDSRLENVGVFFVGNYPSAGIGTAAVNVGDLDGDLVDDVAVGLPGYGQVRVGAGAASVGDPGDIQAIRLEAARTWWGEGSSEAASQAGASLAAGDFDGDGAIDLVAGAPAGGDAGGGLAAVFHGRFAAGAIAPDTRLLGVDADDRVGATLVAGELTGDRHADLALAAPGAEAVYLVDGPFSVGDTSTDAEAYTTFLVPGASAATALPLALGDLDLDGRDDLLVGAPWRDTGRVGAGGVYLCTGGAPGSFDASDHCDDIGGSVAGDSLGASVAAGDLDDDGWLDLVVGAPGVDGGVADVGAVYVFLGREDRFWTPLTADDADVVVLGEEGADGTGGRAGASVAVVGDVNGWGGLDIAVGAPAWNDPYEGYGVGAAYVVVGPWGGGTRSLTDAADRYTCLYTTSVTPGGCAAGTMVAPAGDIDRDGLADLLVGAPGWLFEAGTVSGAVAVVFGKNVR